MKRAKYFAGVLFLVSVAVRAFGQGDQLLITVTSIEKGEGPVIVELYANEDNWLEEPFKRVQLSGEKSRESIQVQLPYGDYAITLYQDQNGNGELDRNFIGIPKEPVGFGNDYRPFGPPRFSSALIEYRSSNYQHQIEIYEAF